MAALVREMAATTAVAVTAVAAQEAGTAVEARVAAWAETVVASEACVEVPGVVAREVEAAGATGTSRGSRCICRRMYSRRSPRSTSRCGNTQRCSQCIAIRSRL